MVKAVEVEQRTRAPLALSEPAGLPLEGGDTSAVGVALRRRQELRSGLSLAVPWKAIHDTQPYTADKAIVELGT